MRPVDALSSVVASSPAPGVAVFVVRLLLAALALSGAAGFATAQPAGDPTQGAAAAAGVPEAAVAETAATAGPDVFLLPDESGKLRRVLGFRYEDFIQAWRAVRNSGGEEADFVLARLDLEAAAEDSRVRVAVRVTVDLKVSGKIAAPLRLGSLIVDSARIEEGTAAEHVTFDARRGGYVAWLDGSTPGSRTVVVRGAVPTETTGGRRRLRLELPAAVTSNVRLNAGEQAIEVESPENALVSSEATSEGAAGPITLNGARGTLVASWEPEEVRTGALTAALEAASEVKILVEPNQISYDASLELTPFGRSIHRVWVHLPPGAELGALAAAPGYDVVAMPATRRDEGGSLAREVVEIRFRNPVDRPTTIHLTAKHVGPDLRAASQERELIAGSFEVLGAYRQSGYAALRLGDQLHADWKEEGRIERIAVATLPARLREGSPLAAFATADADWALRIHTQRRERRMRVTPRYALHFGEETVSLAATLDYQITGGRTFELRVGLKDWELADESVDVGGAAEMDEVHVTKENVLVLPLKDPDAGTIRVQLALRRRGGPGGYELPLLELSDAAVLPADVEIRCDDSERAAIDFARSTGVAEAIAAEASGATSASAAQDRNSASGPAAPLAGADALHVRAFLPAATLAVDVTRREQTIRVESATTVSVDSEEAAVDQRLKFDVRYQPLDDLSATISSELLSNDGFAVLVNGAPAPSDSIDVLPLAETPTATNEPSLRLVVHLPKPALGKIELGIQSRWLLSAAQASGTQPISVPLATPLQRGRSEARAAATRSDLRVKLAASGEGQWTVDDATDDPEASLVVRTDKPVAELPLTMTQVAPNGTVDAEIEATWVQTWIVGTARQDRFAFRVRTRDASVRIALPPGFGDEPLETLVDGQATANTRLASGELSVPLPADPNAAEGRVERTATIELRRLAGAELGWTDRVALDLPQLAARRTSGPFYWHAVLPGEYAALGAPNGLGGEYRVAWKDHRWGRQPVEEQADFERWSGAVARPEPAPSMSQYVYSALAPPAKIELGVMRRIWLTAAGAALALGVGLACLYTPVARSTGFWAVVCVTVAALAATSPELAIGLVQAIVAGAALTAVAAVLKRALDQEPASRPSAAISSSISSRQSTTQPWTAESLPSSDVGAGSMAGARAGGAES